MGALAGFTVSRSPPQAVSLCGVGRIVRAQGGRGVLVILYAGTYSAGALGDINSNTVPHQFRP